MSERRASIFFFFAETEARDRAMESIDAARRNGAPPHISRYAMMGYDDLSARGHDISTNIGSAEESLLNYLTCFFGRRWFSFYAEPLNGRWSAVARGLNAARGAEVVFAFTDAIGLPLLALKKWGGFKPKIVYVSVGLPERISRLPESRLGYVKELFEGADGIISYGYRESERLKEFFGEGGPPVSFIPFGVDTELWRPEKAGSAYDAICVGADPNRDISVFYRTASDMPDRRFLLVTAKYVLDQYPGAPPNVDIQVEITLDKTKELMARSTVVALPVKNNSYSGATTTALQAMAMGKPVVLSRTDAIAEGYHFKDGRNVLFAEPGDAGKFASRVRDALEYPSIRDRLGESARKTVCRYHGWSRFVDDLERHIPWSVR